MSNIQWATPTFILQIAEQVSWTRKIDPWLYIYDKHKDLNKVWHYISIFPIIQLLLTILFVCGPANFSPWALLFVPIFCVQCSALLILLWQQWLLNEYYNCTLYSTTVQYTSCINYEISQINLHCTILKRYIKIWIILSNSSM